MLPHENVSVFMTSLVGGNTGFIRLNDEMYRLGASASMYRRFQQDLLARAALK